MLIKSFDAEQLLERIRVHGFASTPLLHEGVRERLLSHAKQCAYQDAPKYVEKTGVHQELASCENIREGETFTSVARAVWHELLRGGGSMADGPFRENFVFNEVILQRYQAGSKGITPHRDGAKYRNLVCIIVLGGEGTFYACADRAGHEERIVEAHPGWMIAMRAPGLFGEDVQPFHGIKDIVSQRHVLALRQRRAP